jgi:hypothetical protein
MRHQLHISTTSFRFNGFQLIDSYTYVCAAARRTFFLEGFQSNQSMDEWDGFKRRNRRLTQSGDYVGNPTNNTHKRLLLLYLHVAGGDDGGLFLLSSAVVGQEDFVVRVFDYVLRTLDSLRNYICTNVGKIMSIRSFICLFSFGFATTRINRRKTREPIGMIVDEFIRCMHSTCYGYANYLAARLMISYPSKTVMPINVPTEREYEQKSKTPV